MLYNAPFTSHPYSEYEETQQAHTSDVETQMQACIVEPCVRSQTELSWGEAHVKDNVMLDGSCSETGLSSDLGHFQDIEKAF